MAPSAVSMSISLSLIHPITLRSVLEPLRQMRADRSKANDTLVLIHAMVFEYSSPFFRAISSASLA